MSTILRIKRRAEGSSYTPVERAKEPSEPIGWRWTPESEAATPLLTKQKHQSTHSDNSPPECVHALVYYESV